MTSLFAEYSRFRCQDDLCRWRHVTFMVAHPWAVTHISKKKKKKKKPTKTKRPKKRRGGKVSWWGKLLEGREGDVWGEKPVGREKTSQKKKKKKKKPTNTNAYKAGFSETYQVQNICVLVPVKIVFPGGGGGNNGRLLSQFLSNFGSFYVHRRSLEKNIFPKITEVVGGGWGVYHIFLSSSDAPTPFFRPQKYPFSLARVLSSRFPEF